MAKLAASAYGEALFELAAESGSMAEYLEEVQTVLTALDESKELFDLLNNPKIDKARKVKTMEDIFGTRVRKDITGTLVLAVEKDRQNDIMAILAFFIDKAKEYLKIGVVSVSTPMELSQSQKDSVERRIKETTTYTSLEMQYTVDESLIGGMIIRIGDRVVDTSIKTKLAELTKKLNSIQLA